MYSSQNVQIPLSQSSCDIQAHLAEELSNRLTTSGSPATGQSTAYTVNYFSHCSNVEISTIFCREVLLLIELAP